MNAPLPHDIFAAIDATWPPARIVERGPWRLREGKGGGQRVSSATAETPVTETDIDTAEAEMRKLSQRPIFMIRPTDKALDAQLAARGYPIVDPVTAYAVRAETLDNSLEPAVAMPVWPPLAIQREIWQQSGIGPDRIAVMERAVVPRVAILGRSGDTPAGVAYVAVDGGIAMLHALEVLPVFRRTGVARNIATRAATWALSRGAQWLTLVVVSANGPATALYRRLKMTPVTSYHYRRAPDVSA